MVGMIVAALILLLFFAALYMSSKNWRITHVLLLCGVFLMTAFFVVLAAGMLKTHDRWRTNYQNLTKQIKQTEENIARLEIANSADPEVETVPGLKQQLQMQLVDRGRVWRGANPVNAGPNSVEINMTGWGGENCYGEKVEDDEELEPEPDPVVEEPADEDPAADGEGADDEGAASDEDPAAGAEDADPAAGGADAAEEPEVETPAPAPAPRRPAGPTSPHGIQAGTVVYAFLEGASGRLAPAQQAVFFGDSELPKQDRRGACRVPVVYLGSFAVKTVNGNALTLEPLLRDAKQLQISQEQRGTWTLFEVMPVDSHELALANPVTDSGVVAEALAATFPAEYGRDLQPAAAGDSPSQTMVKVKFLKEYDVTVDAEKIAETVSETFDANGLATVAYLRQGAPSKFAEGDEAWVLSDAAGKWIEAGACQRTEDAPLFVRPLRNYDLAFQRTSRNLNRVQSEAAVFQLDNKSITTAAATATKQIDYRKSEIDKINEDQTKVEAELALLSQYQTKLKSTYEAQRQTLSKLYRWNSQNADGLRGTVRVSGQ